MIREEGNNIYCSLRNSPKKIKNDSPSERQINFALSIGFDSKEIDGLNKGELWRLVNKVVGDFSIRSFSGKVMGKEMDMMNEEEGFANKLKNILKGKELGEEKLREYARKLGIKDDEIEKGKVNRLKLTITRKVTENFWRQVIGKKVEAGKFVEVEHRDSKEMKKGLVNKIDPIDLVIEIKFEGEKKKRWRYQIEEINNVIEDISE